MHKSEPIAEPVTTVRPPAASGTLTPRWRGKPGRSGPPGNGNAQTHGAFALKRAVRTLGSRTIDRRTRVGRALATWCEDLARDLGGVEQLVANVLGLSHRTPNETACLAHTLAVCATRGCDRKAMTVRAGRLVPCAILGTAVHQKKHGSETRCR